MSGRLEVAPELIPNPNLTVGEQRRSLPQTPVIERPMRVAFWGGVFPPSYETFIFNQVRGLVERGCDMGIIAQKRGKPGNILTAEELRYFADRIWYRPQLPLGRARRLWGALKLVAKYGFHSPRKVSTAIGRFSKTPQLGTVGCLYALIPFLQAGRFDIIHCQYGPLGTIATELRRRGLIEGKIVTTFRGYDLSTVIQANPACYQTLFQHGDLMMPNNADFQKRLVELGCPAEKIVVQREGINCAQFRFQPRQLRPGQKPRFLTASRLTEKKGIAYVLESLSQVARRVGPVEYRIVGDGPLRAELMARAQKMPPEVDVCFVGWKGPAEVATEMAEAHVLIQASVKASSGNEEGIPNVLKEAMACGMPVIGTYHAGIPELIQDRVSGYLVPERDVDALADCISSLIESAGSWHDMGVAGREKIEAEYDMDKLNDQLCHQYANLLDPK